MMKIYGRITLALCIWLSLAGVCLAKQVYLQDGGIVECKSFWRRGNDVVVLINRDTMVEFGVNELNMKKTFAKTRTPRHAPKKSATVTAPATATSVAQKEAAAPKPAATPAAAKPAPSPAAAPKPVPPAPAATNKAAPAEAAKPAATPPKADPLPTAAPAPVPAPQPSARSAEATPAPAAPAALSKEELEQKRKEAATMMAEALQKNDRELLKKAVALQQSTIQPEEHARAQIMSTKLVLILLVCSLLILISLWVVFAKAGRAGWTCLIPIYNMYILMQISGKPGWWAFLMFIPVVGTIFYLLAMLELADKFGRGALFGVGLCLLPMFCFPLLAFGGSRYEERFAFA
jgi:uncharacterized membrane protein YhaH (DUF805 family)